MRNTSGLFAATLATLALTASPVLAQQTLPDQASDQAALDRFRAAVNAVESGLPSSPYDVAQAGSECSAAIDALTRALPATITSSIRCDVDDTGGIILLGGAGLR